MVQIAVYQKYVVSALMVGDKHIGRMPVDIFPSADLYTHKHQDAPHLRPIMRRIITAPFAHAQNTKQYGKKRRDDCQAKQYRDCYDPLIDSPKEIFHCRLNICKCIKKAVINHKCPHLYANMPETAAFIRRPGHIMTYALGLFH